jgi:hypothetical protein
VATSDDGKIFVKTSFDVAPPSKPDPCAPAPNPDGTVSLGPIVLHPTLQDGATAITGTSPIATGTVVACLKGSTLTLAANAGQKVAKGAFTLTLKDGLQQGNSIDVVATSDDGKTSVKTSFDVAPVKFKDVELSATPKEGQKIIYVSATPSGTVNYSLAAFVNGGRVRVIDSSGNETDAVPTSTASGSTSIQLKDPLDGGQCVQAVEFETGKPLVIPPGLSIVGCDSIGGRQKDYYVSKPVTAAAFFNFGRIRSYLVAGSLLSFDGGSFSQPSVFLDLNANRNWIWGGVKPNGKIRRFMFDTFFEARLTTVPTPACTQTSTTPAANQGTTTTATTSNACSSQSATTTGSTTTTPSLQTVLTSPKAAELQGGATIPIILTTWDFSRDKYGFSLGPIAKVGFLTPVGSQDSTQAATPQSFYTNFGFGARLGFHKLTNTPDIAPELESYIDVMCGRYSNFDFNPDPAQRYSRPWRFAFEGLLKVPTTPFFLGFSANVHQNFGLGNSTSVDQVKDDLRFLFGAKFDAGKLFDALTQIK